MPRLLIQKTSARLYLIEIERRGEIHVLHRLCLGELGSGSVAASRVINEQASAERRAHR